MEQYNESVNRFMKPLFDDEYLLPVVSLVVAIYAALAQPKTPNFLYKLFQNPLFRLVAISYIAYRSTKNFQSSVLIAAAFLSTMQLINKGSLNFLTDNFTNSSTGTVNFPEYFSDDAVPVHDEPLLDFSQDDTHLLAEHFANDPQCATGDERCAHDEHNMGLEEFSENEHNAHDEHNMGLEEFADAAKPTAKATAAAKKAEHHHMHHRHHCDCEDSDDSDSEDDHQHSRVPKQTSKPTSKPTGKPVATTQAAKKDKFGNVYFEQFADAAKPTAAAAKKAEHHKMHHQFHCDCEDSDDSDSEDDHQHSRVPKHTGKPTGKPVAKTQAAKKEKFGNELREAPSGSCGTPEFASF